MKSKKNQLLMVVLALFVTSCVEGPELTEESAFTPFSGEYAVVLYHEFHPSYAASQNMSAEEYEDLMVMIYGENRKILLYGDEQQDPNFVVDIPTREIERPETCRKDTKGTLVYLDADFFRVYDANRNQHFTSFFIPEDYDISGNPVRCAVIGIPAVIPWNW